MTSYHSICNVSELNIVDGVGDTAVIEGDSDHQRSNAPDLPSLLLDNRIAYVGMPLVPAVTELIIAELLYLQYRDAKKPIFMYINSTGCTKADGEPVGFETEGTAIYDTMLYVKNELLTIGVGLAYGHACMLLAAGKKGKRSMLPHATAMLHQPRVSPTGQRQAIEVENKCREIAAQRDDFVYILSKTTGQTEAKLWFDMQRPLYMQPNDAAQYGIVDKVVEKQNTNTLENTLRGITSVGR
jgi:ATP-dependent Clp protease protease subunit